MSGFLDQMAASSTARCAAAAAQRPLAEVRAAALDRKSTRLNSSHT